MTVMHHWWNGLAFVHWDYDPDDVQRLLPEGLEVDTYGGRAWVGLVPFVLRVRHRRTPFVPWACTFPETNVRTYVVGPDGRPGIWFFSLDASRLGAVVVARSAWKLPYMWARMRVRRTAGTWSFESVRRWPGRGARSSVVLRPTERCEADGLASFLTARFVLWSRWRSGFAATVADHDPWQLRHAHVVEADPGLLVAAGLPVPCGTPLAQVADDLPVVLGRRLAVRQAQPSSR
jgi:hypothetical protein